MILRFGFGGAGGATIRLKFGASNGGGGGGGGAGGAICVGGDGVNVERVKVVSVIEVGEGDEKALSSAELKF